MRGREQTQPVKAPCSCGWFRGKDSNLRSRIQSPLPYLLATPERLPGGRGRLAPVDARSRLQSMQNASVAPAGYAKGTAGVGSVGENRASGPSRGRHDGVWRLSISGRGLDGHGDGQRPGDGGSVCADSADDATLQGRAGFGARDRFHPRRWHRRRPHRRQWGLLGRAAGGNLECELQGLCSDHQGTFDGDGEPRFERGC